MMEAKKSYVDRLVERVSRSAESSQIEKRMGRKAMAWVGTLLMLLISAAIVAFFLKDIEWKNVIAASKEADIFLAVFASSVSWFASWIIVTIISQKSVSWFHADFKFWDYFWIRGAGFVLSYIHPSLRSGSALLYQKKKSGISWQALIGTKLFLLGVFGWGYALFFVPATFIYQIMGHSFSPSYLGYIVWFILIFPGVIFFALTLRFFWTGKDFLWIGKLLVRPQHRTFWFAYHKASIKQWGILLGLVLFMVMLHLLSLYYRNIAFGVEVPFVVLLGTFALASIVSDLPIGYAGFGTTTMAWMYFYGDYGTQEQIVALTLFTPAFGLIIKGLIGSLCIKKAMGALSRMSSSEPEN